ncbi:uncharacterized protein LOC113279910 [Papaver somniferum]|uniref:uncharacterized protein LOC113279910 n=1 Tax=Papaver somniferum TaxID=3469 RepID=UPI000E704D89|nr:uncharacterized protein LOC113279910 [Papaver somniferum]
MEAWREEVQVCTYEQRFFVIMLSNSDDNEKISASNWFINHRALKLIDWYPGFNSEKQKTSHAAVWVRFPGLPMKLWTEKSILSMGKILGTRIVVDQRTLSLEYGHFASVLVDIDFAKHIPKCIALTAGGRKFWQYQDIPNDPKFCFACNIIGHCDDECKKKNSNTSSSKVIAKKVENVPLANKRKGNNQQWQVKEKKDDEIGGASNSKVDEAQKVDNRNVKKFVAPVLFPDDKQLEEDLNNSFIEYREAHIKLIRCKNVIAAKAAIAARQVDKSVNNSNSEVTERNAQSKQNIETSGAKQKKKHGRSCDQTKVRAESACHAYICEVMEKEEEQFLENSSDSEGSIGSKEWGEVDAYILGRKNARK